LRFEKVGKAAKTTTKMVGKAAKNSKVRLEKRQEYVEQKDLQLLTTVF